MTNKKQKQSTEVEKVKPEYQGNLQVSMWKKVTKNGEVYYSVKVGQYANCFLVKTAVEESTALNFSTKLKGGMDK